MKIMRQVLHPTMQFYKDPPNDIDCYQIVRKVHRVVHLIWASTVHQRRIESDSETEVEDNNKNDMQEVSDVKWRIPLGIQIKMTFSYSPGINTCQSEILYYTEPHNFYFLFVTDEIFQIIANQTNIYAAQTRSR